MKRIIVLVGLVFALAWTGCKKEPFKGCCEESYKMVIDDTVIVAIPNAFSPNSDHIDDRFRPITRNLGSDYSISWTVSDHDGVVFSSVNGTPWDWAGNGKSGSYNFSVIVKHLATGTEYSKQGNVCVFTKDCIEKGYANQCQFSDGYNYDLTYPSGAQTNEYECR
jgi:hypothetical protein